MKRFDLTTQSGMLEAATTTGMIGKWGRYAEVFDPFGVVEKHMASLENSCRQRWP